MSLTPQVETSLRDAQSNLRNALSYSARSEKPYVSKHIADILASIDNVIGNWWNHKILDADKQISPLSGSIKEQVVKFIGKENLIINNKKYNANHYTLKSKNENLPDDKKLNFDIWYDSKKKILLKVSYSKLGDWEYRLKGIE